MSEPAKKTRQLQFSLHGPSVTDMTREALTEGKAAWAVQLLESCLQSKELTPLESHHMAVDVLNGRAKLVGTYPEPDYGIDYPEDKTEAYDLFEKMDQLVSQLNHYKDLSERLQSKLDYILLSEELCDSDIDDLDHRYMEDYEEWLFPNRDHSPSGLAGLSGLTRDFLERMHDDHDNDYGWLEPNGTFHPVEFAEHESFAADWIKENCTEEEWMQANCDPSVYGGNSVIDGWKGAHNYGDFLANRGWILLHNPHQGCAIVTRDETRRMTKAQKEFLYDYWKDRGDDDRANAVWADDED